MDIAQILQRLNEYKPGLERMKTANCRRPNWLGIQHRLARQPLSFRPPSDGANRDFFSRVGDGLIVDIGAADGDTPLP